MSVFILEPTLDASTGAGGRAERYPMLFEAFSQRPLFGDASYNSPFDKNVGAGAHLHWMSRLTVWGIFGFAFYLSMFWIILKKVYSLFDKQFSFYYSLSILAYVLLGLIKALAGRESFIMLFVVIPGLYFFQFTTTPNKNKSKIPNNKRLN